MDENDKSLERSKKSFFSLADIGVREGINILIPGSSLAYEFGKALFQHGKEFFNDRKEYRINKFHECLLEGVNNEENNSFINQKFSSEDYYSLLSNAVTDDEDTKVKYYSNLFKSIIRNKIENKYKLHILKSLKELSSQDINIMRSFYISSKYEFKGINSIQQQLVNLSNTEDPLKNVALQSLLRFGLLKNKENYFEPTLLLENIITSIFTENELTPESIGQKAWLNLNISVICCDLTKNSEILRKINSILYELSIKGDASVPRERSAKTQNLFCHIFILCFTKDDDLKQWQDFTSKLRNKIFIKVSIEENLNQEKIDPLPNIESYTEISINNESFDGIELLTTRLTQLIKEIEG